ncbi:MAG TPA: DNA repair protein RecO [Patescibacteria group bacterium]|nr:DNA repair protein RecO [Patescibacteria group bacterium]
MARQYDTEAILLISRDWGEADKLLTFFSREYGKISAVAYGVRRGKNPLRGYLQPFSWLDLSLGFRKNSNALDTVQQCAVKQAFRPLREDLQKMAQASMLVEIVTELWPEREPEPLVFDLLIAAFALLDLRNPRIVAQAAAWQLLGLAGFSPVCDECVICGAPLLFPAYFHAAAGGAVCTECCSGNLPAYPDAVNQFIQQLKSLNLSTPEHFSVGRGTFLQAEQLLFSFLGCRLEKTLKSLSFIQQTGDDNGL